MASLKWIFSLALIVVLALVNLPQPAAAQKRDCPDICPALFSPVCATLNNGKKQQFSNSCELQAAACKQRLRIKSSNPGQC